MSRETLESFTPRQKEVDNELPRGFHFVYETMFLNVYTSSL